MTTHDLVIVGGGIAGSTLAMNMAARGFRVLVVERERTFRDRVRGEYIFPWGVAEAIALGAYEPIMAAGGHHPAYWTDYTGSKMLPPRNLAEETPQRLHGLSIYHPHLQEALLAAAVRAGAEVRRGNRVTLLEGGNPVRIHIDGKQGRTQASTRLAVGADGRTSMTRRWGGFESRSDPRGNIAAGVLLENVQAPDSTAICLTNSRLARMVLFCPQSGGRGRAYLFSRSDGGVRLRGASDFERFLEECGATGLPAATFEGARQAGPLATFEGAASWVDHPFANGVALVGDAASTSDPTWGQGLSHALLAARMLRDSLLAHEDWETAGHAYARAHAVLRSRTNTTNAWFTTIFLEPGATANAIRERLFGRIAEDPTLLPDTIFAGPELAPPTDAHRRNIFGDVPPECTGSPLASPLSH
jgi:menaquinone-9 beta-reductase